MEAARSQPLYLPEKVVTYLFDPSTTEENLSQHLYLPEKVVTQQDRHGNGLGVVVSAPVPS